MDARELLGTDAEQSITAVAWSPALEVHRAGLLTPDDAVQPGDKKEDKESGGDAAMQRQSKAAAEKGKVGAGSRTGAIEVEQDAEKLLAEPQKYGEPRQLRGGDRRVPGAVGDDGAAKHPHRSF